MKTIGIVGSRRRDTVEDYRQCEKTFLEIYEEGDSIVSGGCSEGADRFAVLFRDKFNIPLEEHLPDLPSKGSQYYEFVKAYYARNTLIAQDCDILLAMVAPDRKGGTEDTIKKVKKLGKSIVMVL